MPISVIRVGNPDQSGFVRLISAASNSGPQLFYNPSTITIFVTNAQRGNMATVDSAPLEPGGAISFDGSQDVYAFTNIPGAFADISILPSALSRALGTIAINGNVNATVTGNVNVTNTPAVTISGTPNVAISGTPTISIAGQSIPIDVSAATVNINSTNNGPATRLLNDTSNHVIAAGGSFETAVINVANYNSFDIYTTAFAQNQNLVGGAYTIAVAVLWYADAAGTQLIGRETWHIWCSQTVGTLCPAIGTGPVKGASFKLHFDNAIASSTTTVNNIQVYGSPRSVPRQDWRQFPQNLAAPTTPATTWASNNPLTNTGLVGSDNVLAEEPSVALASSTTYWLPLPLFAGPVFLRYQGSVALANQFTLCSGCGLANGTIVAGTGGQVIWTFANDANDHETTIIAPRGPMFAVIKSTTTAPTITFMAQGQQL